MVTVAYKSTENEVHSNHLLHTIRSCYLNFVFLGIQHVVAEEEKEVSIKSAQHKG